MIEKFDRFAEGFGGLPAVESYVVWDVRKLLESCFWLNTYNYNAWYHTMPHHQIYFREKLSHNTHTGAPH